MNKADLKVKASINFNVPTNMGKGEAVSLESIQKMCKILYCSIDDIIDFIDNKN